MAKRQTKEEKAIDRRIAEAYHRTCNGIQIPLLKITAVHAEGRKAIVAGADDTALDAAIRGYVETIRTN